MGEVRGDRHGFQGLKRENEILEIKTVWYKTEDQGRKKEKCLESRKLILEEGRLGWR